MNMEISRIDDTSIRIKGKKISISTDTTKADPDVVLVLSPQKNPVDTQDKFYIEGPGEYEISGFKIKGTREGEGIVYELFDDSYHIRILPSSSLATVKSGEEHLLTIVKKEEGEFDEGKLSSLNSDVIVLYGNKEHLNLSSDNFVTAEKINLKNIDDYKGKVVFLGSK